jgi:tryptophan halogenase
MSDDELTRFMKGIKTRVDNTIAKLPGHQAYVEQYCKAVK